LLIASYALYLSWTPWFALALFGSTAANFLIGEWLRRTLSGIVLVVGVLFNLSLLASFKYLPDAAANLPFSSLQGFAHLALPLGISFWTFQAMSYLFDLYREEELDPSFAEFALYMAFFSVAISGPICRMPDMLPQFRQDAATTWAQIAHGLRRIAIGALMIQLAKLLGQGVLAGDGISSGFDQTTQWSGTDVWCLAFGYGLQLFFDFAGYSHIAIGAAQALGFTVPENFMRPFGSTTPSIFWTRWHMSLSFWIRDYVFLPLAMLRRELWWRNGLLLVSMVLFGLWHKASLLFLLWGCYHGLLLVLQRQVEQVGRRFDWNAPGWLWTPISWMATIALVSLGWIFFRANSLAQAEQMLSAVLWPRSYATHFISGSLYALVFGLAAGYAVVLFVIDRLQRCSEETNRESGLMVSIARWRWYWLPPLYAVALLFVSLITFTRGPTTAQFMYRRF
jgi:D-alanyl-lipoteichoic acid acyltransferase DltB (MBOAT superfamily)